MKIEELAGLIRSNRALETERLQQSVKSQNFRRDITPQTRSLSSQIRIRWNRCDSGFGLRQDWVEHRLARISWLTDRIVYDFNKLHVPAFPGGVAAFAKLYQTFKLPDLSCWGLMDYRQHINVSISGVHADSWISFWGLNHTIVKCRYVNRCIGRIGAKTSHIDPIWEPFLEARDGGVPIISCNREDDIIVDVFHPTEVLGELLTC